MRWREAFHEAVVKSPPQRHTPISDNVKFALCNCRSAVIFTALFSNPMNVVVENLPHCLATLKVEVEPERVSETWNAVATDFGKYAKIAGYRPGKVPRGIIEKKFKKEIRAEVEKKLLNDSTRDRKSVV